MTNNNIFPKIGDIYYMQFGGSLSEQTGWRPGLVFQNNIGNRFSPNIIALPLTCQLKKSTQPTHVVLLASETGLPRDSMVLCENPERMSKAKIGHYITTLSDAQIASVAKASILASSAVSFLRPEELLSVWSQACSLNAAM